MTDATATPAGSGISRIKRTRAAAKPTPSQLPYAGLLILGIIVFGFFLSSPKLVLIWIVSVALGLVLQRSRFCFTAAMRDPVLTGGTSLTKAVVIGLAVATVGFTAISMGPYLKSGELADAAKMIALEPVGIHTAIGAFLFGIGAVIAGGCASGTLMRVGEGYAQQMIALVFFVIGSGLGAATWPIWRDALGVNLQAKIYMPELLGGMVPALIVQFALLFAVWFAADWWSKRKAS